MTEKDIRRLSRGDLIDIIYQLQRNEANLIKMNEDLKARLDSKEMKIAKAGSIAEAAISVSGVFEKAQQAADLYLEELHRTNAELEERCRVRLSEAENEAARILADADAKAKAKIAAATKAIERYFEDHPELRYALSFQEDDHAR